MAARVAASWMRTASCRRSDAVRPDDLCSGEVDLTVPADLRRAVHRYNQSGSYVSTVVAMMRTYAQGSVMPAVSRRADPTPPGPSDCEPERPAPAAVLLTRTQAFLECTLRGLTPILAPRAFDRSVVGLIGDQVTAP